uniref:Uncharacterized protein n=1 Tax=Cucumis sativus TaxID=3659 RepID=A0A0A0KFY7_CUCSA
MPPLATIFNNSTALVFPFSLPFTATSAISLKIPDPKSFTSSAALSPPHLAKFNNADTAFSFVLKLEPVPESNKSTKTPNPETLRNANSLSSHPATCATTADASSTIPA